MRRVVAIFLAYAYSAACLPSEKAHCEENAQCNVGYYCNVDHYSCFKCMRCEDLKRASLPVISSCIKSIAECGPCLDGLAADPSGNLDAPCVPADSLPGTDPSYMWIALAAAAVCLLLLVAALLYVLRHTDTFKMVSFTRASFQSPCAGGTRAEPGVPPPPYAAAGAGTGSGVPAAYAPVRPTSPPLEPETSLAKEDSSRPFIKRADSRRVRAPRERDSNQEAQVFNNPHYVRGPELPPSYDSTVNGEEASPELHDEETMESLWTPADDANNNFAHTSTALPEPGSAAELSTLLSEARGTTVVRPPDRADRDEATPSKVICVRQDSNNNGARRGRLEPGEGSAGAAPAPPAAPHLTALNFNITVQQHNDVKLIST